MFINRDPSKGNTGHVKWTNEQFLSVAESKHPNGFLYHEPYSGSHQYMPMTCKKCNFEFTQRLSDHLSRQKPCPNCRALTCKYCKEQQDDHSLLIKKSCIKCAEEKANEKRLKLERKKLERKQNKTGRIKCTSCNTVKAANQFPVNRRQCIKCTRERARNNAKKRKSNEASCVYKITCIPNGRIYIGQTNNFRTRELEHISKLKNGTHYIEEMLEDFKELGEDSFVFEIIKLVEDREERLQEETNCIQLHLKDGFYLYNRGKTIEMNSDTKVCTKCNTLKPHNMFGSSNYTNDSMSYWCKSCKSENERERRKQRKININTTEE